MKQKTIGEIKAELKAAEESMLPVFIENYKEDTRNGVQAAVAQAKKRIEKLEAERARIEVLKNTNTSMQNILISVGLMKREEDR